MAWGSTFLGHLEDGAQRPRLRLIFGPATTPKFPNPGPSSEIVLTNYVESGSYNCIGSTCRVSGAALDPLTRRYTASQLEITFNSDDALRAMLDYYGTGSDDDGVRRGTAVTLEAGFPGMAVANYEVVFSGFLRNITKTQGTGATEWRVVCWDIVASLQSYTGQSGVAGPMFGRTGGNLTTTCNLPYTAGTGGPLTVANNANFTRRTGGSGLLLCYPTGGATPTPFFLTYTGVGGATQFTGCNTTNIFNTTQQNLAIGDVIEHVGYVYGHPINIFREMATSTGAGTNGAYDVYPSRWGWGIPAGLTDNTDMGNWVTASGNTAVWNLVVEEPQSQPLRFIEDKLSKYGIFPAMRQGALTCRAFQRPDTTPTYTPAIDLEDEWISEVSAWEAFDSSHSYEISTTYLYNGGNPRAITGTDQVFRLINLEFDMEFAVPNSTSAGGAIGGAAATLPVKEEFIIDESDLTWGPGGTTVNPLQRIAFWMGEARERISLRGRGLYWAQLCVGDRPSLTTTKAFGAKEARNGGTGTYSSADVMVVRGPDVDWIRGRVSLDVIRYIPRVL